tara:strand:- start:297 stop:1589 length:1293 start_codon:yes stop_codon:yes gene_type:complete
MGYLYRNNSSGSGTTATISAWVKCVKTDHDAGVFQFRTDANNQISFYTNPVLKFRTYIGSSYSNGDLVNNGRKFRDFAGWYHLVATFDTTNATSGDRLRLYINGVRQTVFTTANYPSQNYSYTPLVSGQFQLGRYSTGDRPTYLAHVHYCDGYAYDASAFGSTDSVTGQWNINTAPNVQYGTNGVFLKFGNSGSMGADSSGNSNTMTISGSCLQTQDNPNNNFCTLDPLTKHASDTVDYGNTKWTAASGVSYSSIISTLGFNTGKYYAEAKIASASTYYPVVGIASSEASAYYYQPSNSDYIGDTVGSAGLFMHGDIQIDSSTGSPAPANYNTGDIVGLAVDLDSATKTLKLYRNGSIDQTYTITAPKGFYHFGCSGGGTNSDSIEWNFGNGYFGSTAITSEGTNASGIGKFEYDVPAGYTALSTKGLNE